MKFSAQEEYGLRCLLEVARLREGQSLTIQEIGRLQGLSPANVAKLMAILRKAGFVEATRGQNGGYTLARPADRIVVGEVLAALGGRLYEEGFCERFARSETDCSCSVSCALRVLWSRVQQAVDSVVNRVTIADILSADDRPLIRLQPRPSAAREDARVG
ncbi:MAG: Rrf2 family transcriptional regulator [Fimbriimonadaceae bacterium]